MGDAPDDGVKNASVEENRWPKEAGILFRPGRDALDDFCHESASPPGEARGTLLHERQRALEEVLVA